MGQNDFPDTIFRSNAIRTQHLALIISVVVISVSDVSMAI